jgi:glycosyltransferase involved in cell wall biosynthesis
MQFHQILVGASAGDAITNEALEIRRLLRQLGASEIFARYIDPAISEEVLPLSAYPKGYSAVTYLLFHASIGEPSVHSFLIERPEPLILIYHNLSPSESFALFDLRFAHLLELGRLELAALRERTLLALADSSYNAEDLRRLGYGDVRVAPLIFDPTRLLSIEPDRLTVKDLDKDVQGPAVMFVGQILPHKRIDLLVHAYHVLSTYLIPEAHLFLVGSPRVPSYWLAIKTLINELNLYNAYVTGGITDAQLAAYYRRADLFVTLSEHEGFCVPVLEAMAFGLPVVARRCAALPETIGYAGLMLPAEPDVLLAAEAMAAFLASADLRENFIRQGRQRFDEFNRERSEAIFLQHLESII